MGSLEIKLRATMFSGAISAEKGATIPVNRNGVLEETYWDFSYSPIFLVDGSIGGVFNISRDVTKELVAEREMRRLQRLSDQILGSIGDAVIATDTASRVTRMNLVGEDITGWSLEEALGQPLCKVLRLVDSATRHPLECPADKVLRLGTAVKLPSRTILLRRDGREVHVEDSAAPVWDDDGAMQGTVLVFRDVTEQRQVDAFLEEVRERVARSEANLKLITDALPAYVSYLDRDLRYILVNRAYEDLLGRASGKIIGKTIDEVLGAPAAAAVRGPLTRALQGERQCFSYEITENGKVRVLNVSHIPDMAPDGTVRGVVVEAHDITEQKRMEGELKRSDDRFRSLIDNARVGVAIGSSTGKLTYLNPALLKLLGYTREDVASGAVRWDQLTPEKYAEQDRRAAEELGRTGVASPYEKVCLAKDGTPVPLLIGASVIPSIDPGAPEAEIAVFTTDLTLQKKAEVALLQTEKLAVVGKLASTIAHEINNPLEAVTNLIYIARQSKELSQPTRDLLDSADRELARVAQVTTQTLRFHRQSTAATSIKPEELIEEVIGIFGTRLVNSQVEIRRFYEANTRVTCFEGDIRQVLANIIGNAIDAMKKGGTMSIRTRYATRWSSREPGVLMTISDTGAGMSEETRSHIFDAFYTTKGINGTGLGLWISCRIVHKHKGFIRTFSSTNPLHHGSTFMLWLPLELAHSAGELL